MSGPGNAPPGPNPQAGWCPCAGTVSPIHPHHGLLGAVVSPPPGRDTPSPPPPPPPTAQQTRPGRTAGILRQRLASCVPCRVAAGATETWAPGRQPPPGDGTPLSPSLPVACSVPQLGAHGWVWAPPPPPPRLVLPSGRPPLPQPPSRGWRLQGGGALADLGDAGCPCTTHPRRKLCTAVLPAAEQTPHWRTSANWAAPPHGGFG